MSGFKAKIHQNPSSDPVGKGANSAPPNLLVGFKRPTSKERAGGVLWSPKYVTLTLI